MLFNSVAFLIFLPVVFGVYWLLPQRAQNVFLLAASYFFYAWWDWRFLSLLLLSTALDYGCALGIEGSADPRRRRLYLLASLSVNLGLLGFFKYFGFFVDSASSLLLAVGLDPLPWHLDVVLPVGISFYTFQSMCYPIDVYRGQIDARRDLLDVALYVAFFPQLVAGPIERAGNMLPQIGGERHPVLERVTQGLGLATWGFFKKVAIADNIAAVIDPIFANLPAASAADVLAATVLFAAQIYADFSGYTDIARGTARMLGFELSLNFVRPYLARNPVEFWERWHMSLSAWFKDYLYFPLAMHFMRRGTGWWLRYLPHFISMGLIGLWHGASFNFLLFGLYWGLCISLHIALSDRLPAVSRTLACLTHFAVVCGGWLLFRVEHLGNLTFPFWHRLAPGFELLRATPELALAAVLASFLLALDVVLENRPELLARLDERRLSLRFAAAVALAVVTVFCRPTHAASFLYFQF